MMNARQRFHETMDYGTPDRVPYFEEGIRDDVINAWQTQGLAPELDLATLFPTDSRQEIMPELDPLPRPKRWPKNISDLGWIQGRLDPTDPRRLPDNWAGRVLDWREQGHVVMLRLHRGLFQTLGIQDWRRFQEIMYLFSDDPDFIHETMMIQTDFVCQLVERIFSEVEIDAAIFSEPIGGNDRALVSPKMYETFALNHYKPIIEMLHNLGVKWIIFRTYANARVLLPSIMKWGFNCLWACEVNLNAMDYQDLRREYGRDLRLIGGIDVDILRQDKAAIQREIEEKVPPLLADGGYIPLADGRVRADVPFDNYVYYRQLLEEVTANTQTHRENSCP